MKRGADFYGNDIVARALAGTDYQRFVDSTLADLYKNRDTKGFEYDPIMQYGFTYQQLQEEHGVSAMSSYIDFDSEVPLRSVEGVETLSGDIPRFGDGYSMNEKQMREKLLLAQQGLFNDDSRNSILSLLYNSTEDLIMSVYNTLSYQRHQMISTGELNITDANNPRGGIKNIKFKAGIPDENITALSGTARWFTDADLTEGAASDPIKVIVDELKRRKNAFMPTEAIEMSKELWDAFLGHSKVLIAVGYYYNPESSSDAIATNIAKRLPEDDLKRIIERKLGIRIDVIDKIVAVEKYNKAKKEIERPSMSAFDVDRIAFIPSSNLGTIKVVKPLTVGDPAVKVAFYDSNRIMLLQSFNERKTTFRVESQFTGLCVPNKSKYISIIKVR